MTGDDQAVRCECERCFYCGHPLSPVKGSHEHDHFPIPTAAGGTATVPACITCHDFKDRVPFLKWPTGMAHEAFQAWTAVLPPPGPGRLLLGKLLALAANGAIPEPGQAAEDGPLPGRVPGTDNVRNRDRGQGRGGDASGAPAGSPVSDSWDPASRGPGERQSTR